MDTTICASLHSAVECAPDQDLELVEASRRGDVAAFDEIVCRYDRKLFRIAQTMTHNVEEAQEVVQAAFVEAFQNLNQFQADAKFSIWLIRIILNDSLLKMPIRTFPPEESVGRDLYGRGEDSTHGRKFAVNSADWDPRLEMLFSKGELQDILTKCLRRLPPILRLIFVLRDIERHSIADTAAILGLSPVAIQTRISRARMHLRQELNPYFKV